MASGACEKLTASFLAWQIDTYLQEYKPTTHLIIEPHPDVLAHARETGWFDKPGVRFYPGTWQAYLKDLEDEKEPYLCFDAVYFGEHISFRYRKCNPR